MLANLLENIQSIAHFTADELSHFQSLIELRKFKKHDIILRKDKQCDFVGFIDKGLVRLYFEEGRRQTTVRLLTEHQWFSEDEAFIFHYGPGVIIEALEEVDLLVITHANIEKAYNRSQSFERFGRLMTERSLHSILDQKQALSTLSPQERYRQLLSNHPSLAQRAALKHIASLLGITAESLSRIRKHMAPLNPPFQGD